MKAVNGIEMLEISTNLMGRPNTYNATLIWDDETVILVDAGSSIAKLRTEFEKAGVPFDKLSKVIITHHDLDHIGGLPALVQEVPQIEVLAHEEEKPYIEGDKRNLKMTPEKMAQMKAQFDSMPEEKRKIMHATFENPPKARVNKTLSDGEELPYCGGIIVIHTPGHTHGHISLYHKQSKTLVAGDALNVMEGQLVGPNPLYSFDIEQAKRSLQKLTQYNIENVICYHGGLFKGNANERIAELSGE